MNRMKFNKRKCWILHLRWTGHMYKFGDQKQGSSPKERDLGIWIGGKSNMSLMATKTANHSQEYIKHKIIGWSRNVTVPLYTALGWPHLESCVSSGHLDIWTSHSGACSEEGGQADGGRTQGQDLRGALRSLGLCILEKWRLGGTPSRWTRGGEMLTSSLWEPELLKNEAAKGEVQIGL